jgi:hypothetical protein
VGSPVRPLGVPNGLGHPNTNCESRNSDGASEVGLLRASAAARGRAGRPRRLSGGSASAQPGSALRASHWSRMGNEGEDPGAWCALSRAACRRARVFRNTLAGDRSNCSGLAPFSEAKPEQFATCPGSAALSAAKPGQFGLARSGTRRRRPDHPPSLPKRDQQHGAESGARRRGRQAQPGAADAKPNPPPRTPTPTADAGEPRAASPSSPSPRGRAPGTRGDRCRRGAG